MNIVEYLKTDKQARREFETLFLRAIDSHQETFVFQGEQILTKYAKYLLEYLKGR